MAAIPKWTVLRKLDGRIKSVEHGFLGTAWSFIVLTDGRAFWINAVSGTVLPSARNGKVEDGRTEQD